MGLNKSFIQIFVLVAITGFSNQVLAKKWTNDKAMKIDFSQTDINPKDVEISYSYECTYRKKVIDIIEGRIGERTVSCGEKKSNLQVKNGEIVLSGVEEFSKNSKSKDLNLYTLHLKMMYKGNILYTDNAFKEAGIKTFMNKVQNLTFKKFEVKDLVVTYQGINLVDHPEFKGKETEVTTYFYVKNAIGNGDPDTNFRISFKWYLTPYSHINRNDMSRLGHISIAPAYHAFINDEERELSIDVYAKNKDDKFVVADKIVIPFTQEAIDNMKSVELTTIK